MNKSCKGILEMLAQNAPTESIIAQFPDRSDYSLLKSLEAIIYIETDMSTSPPILVRGKKFEEYHK